MSDQAYQVHVSDKSVIVEMGAGKTDDKLATRDFADKPLTVSAPTETMFYVALDDKGNMCRNVSSTVEDRKTVAALVGNWVAEGFQVQLVNRKDLMKHVRKLETAAKELAEQAAAAAAASPVAPVAAETPVVAEQQGSTEPVVEVGAAPSEAPKSEADSFA